MFVNTVIILIAKKKNFHCNFEKGISNAAEKFFPKMKIKYCIWHYKKSLKIKKK